MNYGEELAYWYLRLNGFFPIVDFVLHSARKNEIGKTKRGRTTSDCDLLAIRMPNAYEKVGGTCEDLDELFGPSSITAVICQVKAGTTGDKYSFQEADTRRCLERLGIFADDEVPHVIQMLMGDDSGQIVTSSKLLGKEVTVIKLLICRNGELAKKAKNKPLSEVRKFIRDRLHKYSEKRRDWDFYPSSLIQNMCDEVEEDKRTKSSRC